jgi:hypothetical protein
VSEFERFKQQRDAALTLDPADEQDCPALLDWLSESLTSNSWERRGYLHLDGKASISFEGDLVEFAKKFSTDSGFQQQESGYWLIRIWEELVQRHAFREAFEVDRILEGWPIESGSRRFWRKSVYYYPRIGISLAIGYLSLLGAGSIRNYLGSLAKMGDIAYSLTMAAFLALGIVFAIVEVQRRLVYAPGSLYRRTRRMILCGWAYAGLASVIHMGLKGWLKRGPWWDWRICFLVAATALMIGFAAHLFWREKAASEPL